MKPSERKASLKMLQIMFDLGCAEIPDGIFRHPDINFDLDLTATSEDKIMLRLMYIFLEKGYYVCKQELSDFLEI